MAADRAMVLKRGRVEAVRATGLQSLDLPDRPGDLPQDSPGSIPLHSAATFGERVVVKLVRRVRTEPNHERTLIEFLNADGQFTRVPTLAGSLEYRDADGGSSTVALIESFVRHQTNAWRQARAELERFSEATVTLGNVPATPLNLPSLWTAEIPEFAGETVGAYLRTAAKIGQRLGELHTVLRSSAAAAALGSAEMTAADVDTAADRTSAAWERARERARVA